MTTYSWIQANNGDWTVSGAWTQPGFPSNGGDTAVIGATGSLYTVTLSTSESVAVLDITSADVTLDITAGSLNTGTIMGAAGSTIDVATGAKLSAYAATDESGVLNLMAGSTLGAATLTASQGSVVDLGAGAVLTGYGATTLAGAMDVNGGTVAASNGFTETATGALTVAAAGSLYDGSAITIAAGARATLETGATLATSALTVNGTIVAVSGTDTIAASSINGGGAILAQGGTALVTGGLIGTTAGLEVGADSAIETTGALYYGAAVAVSYLGTGGGFVYDNGSDGHVIFKLAGMEVAASGATYLDLALSPGITVGTGGRGVGTTGTVVLSNGDTLALTGITGGGPWAVEETADGSGTAFSLAPVCYAAGTRLRTPDGERPIETLAGGDLVVTLAEDGQQAHPVVWIGRRGIDLARHPRPEMVAPIRIRRGAFAEAVPQRDLLVSPDHAILCDGMLIAARQLVNGASILQEPARGTVTYLHVELDTHAILLAEGLAAESYLDTGNRGFFANGTGTLRLHPEPAGDHADRAIASCAPFVLDPDRVRPVWEGLTRRARALGLTLPSRAGTTEPALRVRVDARDLTPTRAPDGTLILARPAGGGAIRLISRAARPTELQPWVEDRRRLGVCVRCLRLRDGAAWHDIPLDDPGLTGGWWAIEAGSAGPRRWTDGDALVPLPARRTPCVLEIGIDHDAMTYPRESPPRTPGGLTRAGMAGGQILPGASAPPGRTRLGLPRF